MLNQEHFPCGSLPATHIQMSMAKPCPVCGSTNITPVSDGRTPPVLAVACQDCGEIDGDAPTLAEAVANWNNIDPL